MVPNVIAAEPHVYSPGMGLGHYSSPRNPPSATQVMFAPQEGISHLQIDYGEGCLIYFTQQGDVVVLLFSGGGKGSQKQDIRYTKDLARDL